MNRYLPQSLKINIFWTSLHTHAALKIYQLFFKLYILLLGKLSKGFTFQRSYAGDDGIIIVLF